MSKWHSMNKKRSRKKDKPHDKKHRAAASVPEVRKQIQSLADDWKNITAVERGDRVQQLVGAGCSGRGIARSLDVSEKLVRLAVDAAQLPDEYRQMIQRGVSPKRVLTRAHAENKPSQAESRRELERRTGAPSTRLANEIAYFLLTECPSVLCFTRGETFFEKVDRRPGYTCACLGPYCSLQKVIKQSWVKPEPDWVGVEECINGLIRFMLLREPDDFIRGQGFKKAIKMLSGLQLELDEFEPIREEAKKLSPRAIGKRLRALPERIGRFSGFASLIA